jgi:hypothetical protein
MHCNIMPGRTKRQKLPLKNRRGAHGPRVQAPKTEHNQNNKLTVYLVNVASADHCDRALRPGTKQNLEKKAKPNFQGNVSRTKACTAVVSSAGRTTQGREGAR